MRRRTALAIAVPLALRALDFVERRLRYSGRHEAALQVGGIGRRLRGLRQRRR